MKKKIISVVLTVLLILAINNYSKAATASIQCSETAEVNNPITISVTGSAVQWNLNLKVNGTTIVSNSELDNVNGNKTISFSGKYTPTSEGNLTVTLEGSVTESSDGSTIKNFASKTIKVTKQNSSGNNNNSGTNNNNSSTPTTPSTTEKSNVATLANLGITPNDFSGFKANTFNYNVEVPNEIESIEVYAKKGQNGQTISGLGTKKLNEGQNKIEVIVTAEDGKTKKTYTINVTRKNKEEIQQEEQPEEQNEDQPMEEIFGLSELKIEGYELDPQFQTDIYEYRVDLKEDLEKLDITTLATEANSTVEVTGNENLVDGENIITITVKGENEEKIATYQIIVNKILSTTKNDTNLETDHKQMISQIVIISAILVIAFVILIIIIVKIKKTKNSDGYIPYENILENNNEENDTKKNDEDETIKEEIKRKKHSKGKRFK